MSKSDVMESFGKHIKELRRSLGLTQPQFAEKLGTTQSEISLIERGATEISLPRAARYAQILGVSLDSLTEELVET